MKPDEIDAQDAPEVQPIMRLQPDLRAVLRDVGPERYALATAAEFARGGIYNPAPRPAYSLT